MVLFSSLFEIQTLLNDEGQYLYTTECMKFSYENVMSCWYDRILRDLTLSLMG
jgi:hypothetical protein